MAGLVPAIHVLPPSSVMAGFRPAIHAFFVFAVHSHPETADAPPDTMR
jgi:hypothetical protein